MAKKKQSESFVTKSTMVLRPRTPTAGEEKVQGKAKGKKTVGRGLIQIVDAVKKNIKETPLTIRSLKPVKNIHATRSTMVLRPRTPNGKVEMHVKVDEKTKGKMSVEVNEKTDGKKTVSTGKIKIGNAVKIGTSAKKFAENTEVAGSITYKNNRRMKRKKTNILVTFPPEIIMEILSWLPVEFFGTPMVVCKQWYASIQDRHFIEKHMKRNFNYTKSKVRQGYKNVYTCEGLKLEMNTSTYKYCIRNPDTKQFLELPDPPSGSYVIFFAYVPLTLNYKVVSIYEDENNIQCCDLSVENDDLSWRLLEMPTIDYLERNTKKFSTKIIGDVVHCVRVFASGDDMVEEVVSLDLGTEQFSVTNLPKGQYKSWEKVWPISFKGKLALVDIIETELCVLVLENYKKQKWGKKEPLFPLELMKKLEVEHGTIYPILVDKFETLWFWGEDAKKYISYDIKTNCVYSDRVYGHSLVYLKRMQPEWEMRA